MNIDKKKVEESLDIIEVFFKGVKDLCMEGHYTMKTGRLNTIPEIIRCIQFFALIKNKSKLRGRKLEVLAYYLKSGYSRETKKDIISMLKITDSNLNNINHELRKLGAIETVGYNENNNQVNKELLEFKEFIVDNKKGNILIKID